MREAGRDGTCEAKGEPRLAAAAGTGQGHDPARGQRVLQAVDLRLTADERGHLAGQVRRRLDRPQWTGIVRGASHGEPIESGGFLEVLDRAKTFVDQPHAIEAIEVGGHRQGLDELLREHDLATVPGRRDAGGVVHVDADVVLGRIGIACHAEATLTDVDAHADVEARAVRPRLCRDRSLGGDRGRDRGGRVIEGGEEGVALGLDDEAAVRLDGRPQELVVTADDAGPGDRSGCPFEPRRTLDVREQEGDGRPDR